VILLYCKRAANKCESMMDSNRSIASYCKKLY
jgi:hypothetical protein